MGSKYTFERKVGGQKNFFGWKDWVAGDILTGKLLSVETDNNPAYKDKLQFEIKILENLCENLTLEVGQAVTLNEAGTLKRQYEKETFSVGDVLQLRYNGKSPMGEKTAFPGQLAHNIEISVASPEELGPVVEDSNDESDDFDI